MNKIEKVNSSICDRLINISFKDYQNILLENGYDEDIVKLKNYLNIN